MSRVLASRLFDRMSAAAGPRRWWPCDRRGAHGGHDEIVIGAVLTQNTAWRNVERAMANLKQARLCRLTALARLAPERIAPHIRPAGYFNVKARRLSAVARFFAPKGRARFAQLEKMDDVRLRDALLDVHGVGRETADSILLYALGRPTFVVDAYTLRIGRRHGLFDERTDYEAARAWFQARVAPDPALWNEYHALLVWVGHRHCKPRPRCAGCPLARRDCCADGETWRAIRGIIESPAS